MITDYLLSIPEGTIKIGDDLMGCGFNRFFEVGATIYFSKLLESWMASLVI